MVDMVTLEAPEGQTPSAVHLLSGKIVKPDSLRRVYIGGGDSGPLVRAGWQVVQPLPLPPRRAA
jgi:hypothetical protein